MSRNPQRVLVLAHAHPDFQLGGGELAAYNLYKAYGQVENIQAYFIGRKITGGYPLGRISMRRLHDYLWEQSCEVRFMRSLNLNCLSSVFADLVKQIDPTIIHLHHYVHLGIDTIYALKRIVPNAKIMLTLHEYYAICPQNGQMLKLNDSQLCMQASPEECAQCVEDFTPEDIWLRKHSFESVFSLVDQFVSPSEFLRERYIEWGLPPDKIVVIENGQADEDKLPPRQLGKNEKRNRIAYFGQCTPFKGLDVLFEALSALPKEKRKGIVLEVHGTDASMHAAVFQEKIVKLRKPLEKEGILQWVGPYHPSQMRKRMANIDWVVVPSIWWENSPMVIQEAFVHGRPLLVSDIGGMAEKVRDGVDGIHVQAGNRFAWADALVRAAGSRSEWDRLYAGITKPITCQECAERHLLLLNAH